MKIDLHIHTKTGSDGSLSVEDVFKEAHKRQINFLSITDHDSIDCQEQAFALAQQHGMHYVTGIELNVAFQYIGKAISLDFLGYDYDFRNTDLKNKLRLITQHREDRARQILDKLNTEFDKDGIVRLTPEDVIRIRDSVDGTFGRPHIADYLISKAIVATRQEAFDRYLIKCDVPKYPLPLAEASALIRDAGGTLVLAHGNDPQGTSLTSITRDLREQTDIISQYMLQYVDGLECWHSRHDTATTTHYVSFAKEHNMVMTGGSDCHQRPIIMGTVEVPGYVVGQFRKK